MTCYNHWLCQGQTRNRFYCLCAHFGNCKDMHNCKKVQAPSPGVAFDVVAIFTKINWHVHGKLITATLQLLLFCSVAQSFGWAATPNILLLFYPVPRNCFLHWLFGTDFPGLVKYHRSVLQESDADIKQTCQVLLECCACNCIPVHCDYTSSSAAKLAAHCTAAGP